MNQIVPNIIVLIFFCMISLQKHRPSSEKFARPSSFSDRSDKTWRRWGELLPVMILLSFAMCRTLVVLGYGHTNTTDPICRLYGVYECHPDSSLGILDLFCLNGAFLLLPSILSLLVVMTVFFGSFHFFFFFCELEGFLKFRLVFTWSLKYCKEGITAMKISSRFYYRLEKNPSTLSILTVCFVHFF